MTQMVIDITSDRSSITETLNELKRKEYKLKFRRVKGFLIDTCNVYMDNISREMMEKLK